MAYDFTRPFVDSAQFPTYVAMDNDVARQYGKTVRATEMSNVEYAIRHQKFSANRTMRPALSHNRIFPPVVRLRTCAPWAFPWTPMTTRRSRPRATVALFSMDELLGLSNASALRYCANRLSKQPA
jgi:hypothetical protein